MTPQQKSQLRRAGGGAAVVVLSALTSVAAQQAKLDAAVASKLDTQRFVTDSINRFHEQRETDATLRQLLTRTDSVLACVRDIAYRVPVRGCR